MHLERFDYALPEALIAQEALPDRGASRLLVVGRRGEAVREALFRDLPEFLDENDVLVVNRSRVVPARLYLRRPTGGRVEALFVQNNDDGTFDAWLRPMRRIKPGEVLKAEDGETSFVFVGPIAQRMGRLRLESAAAIEDVLERVGHVPLPPYIRRPDTPADHDRYQTVYAVEKGSVAAPTAGLHFDEALLASVKKRGTEILSLVLHVGPGTFAPLEHEEVEANTLHTERVHIGADTVEAIQMATARGKRIVAVGTTVTRALEFAASQGWFEGDPGDRHGTTNLFIYPGYEFSTVGGLITNFHLPRSSLLVLVCAFGTTERILGSYAEAVARGFRFYSYGDAMFVG